MPEGWGIGKKLKNVSFPGHFFLTFLQILKKMKQVVEIGQICSDWAHIDSGRIPASSFRLPGGVWPIFPKNRGKMKIRIFPGGKKNFESIAKFRTQRPQTSPSRHLGVVPWESRGRPAAVPNPPSPIQACPIWLQGEEFRASQGAALAVELGCCAPQSGKKS